MKNHITIALLLLCTTLSLAQNKEKIKGSKTVTIVEKEVTDFDTLELNDNIEVYLEKGEKSGLKFEADDNLHEIFKVDSIGKTLSISTRKTARSFKKLMVRITYTNYLKSIIVKDEVILNAIQEIHLKEISIKATGDAELHLNVNASTFNLEADHETEMELNLKSENATVIMSEKSILKALIASKALQCDLYQKAEAILEGDVSTALIRLDNNSELTANKLFIETITLKAEDYSTCSVNATKTLALDASGNAKIELYGDQKIEMTHFIDNATLSKKPTK